MITQVLTLENPKSFFWKDIATMLFASLLIALFTNCRIFLPFSPVPIALQAHVILTLAVVLGSRKATLATLSWLGQGLMGLPVFSGGVFGLAALAGPTGGYLLGFVAAAFLTGWIMERSAQKTIKTAFLAMLAGNIVIYLFGMAHLSLLVGLKTSFLIGVLPFILGDFIKLSVAARFCSFSKANV